MRELTCKIVVPQQFLFTVLSYDRWLLFANNGDSKMPLIQASYIVKIKLRSIRQVCQYNRSSLELTFASNEHRSCKFNNKRILRIEEVNISNIEILQCRKTKDLVFRLNNKLIQIEPDKQAKKTELKVILVDGKRPKFILRRQAIIIESSY